jgi:hypothetical protein
VNLPLPSELCPHFPNPSFPARPGSERRSPANEGVRVAAWALFGSEHPRALEHPNPGGSGLDARLALNRFHSVRAQARAAGPHWRPLPLGLFGNPRHMEVFLRATPPPRGLSDSPTLFPSAAQHRLSGTRQSARKWHNPFTQLASERPPNLHCECEQRYGGDTPRRRRRRQRSGSGSGDDKGREACQPRAAFLL